MASAGIVSAANYSGKVGVCRTPGALSSTDPLGRDVRPAPRGWLLDLPESGPSKAGSFAAALPGCASCASCAPVALRDVSVQGMGGPFPTCSLGIISLAVHDPPLGWSSGELKPSPSLFRGFDSTKVTAASWSPETCTLSSHLLLLGTKPLQTTHRSFRDADARPGYSHGALTNPQLPVAPNWG